MLMNFQALVLVQLNMSLLKLFKDCFLYDEIAKEFEVDNSSAYILSCFVSSKELMCLFRH